MPTLSWLTRDEDLNIWNDAAEDRAIGAAWERAGGGLYLMARARDEQGRGVLAQLMDKLRKVEPHSPPHA